MKKNIIAVCDTDAEYACNFAEYLNHRRKLPFQAEAFTDVDKLCKYAGESPPEILLIAESDVNDHVEKLSNDNMILLSEDKESEGEVHKCVYKYQSADSIINEVMEYYAKTPSAAVMGRSAKKMSVFGVYSPTGRCGKTLFALTAGQILAEKKSVLYLNMEEYSGFEGIFRREYEKNLGDLLYGIRCKSTNILCKLESMTEHIGRLEYIPPVDSPEDIRDTDFAEWMQLVNIIRGSGRYEVLILDIGNSVDQIFRLLDFCGRVFMPVQDDRIARCKKKQFWKLMDKWSGEEENRITEIRLPVNFPDTENENFMETLLWSKWGIQIRKVLEADERSAGKEKREFPADSERTH